MGLSRCFASIQPAKKRKKTEKTERISLQGESSLPAKADFHHLKFVTV
jgi:hypothetical protein